MKVERETDLEIARIKNCRMENSGKRCQSKSRSRNIDKQKQEQKLEPEHG